MRRQTVLVFGLLLILEVGSGSGRAQVVPGGGSDDTDCFVTYDSIPSPNLPKSKPKHLRCADQDVACGDADPRLGYCEFQLQVEFNSTGFAPCTPIDMPAGSFLIPYSGATNDDHPKHIADFEFFQQFAEDNLPLTSAMTDVASGFRTVTVPMTIAFTSRGPKFKTSKVAMRPTACSLPLVNGRCNALKDKDTFKIMCTPAVDAMTGERISPCTGVTGTFQQIQEHIFDRKCSNQATCHGSVTSEHDLCLAPSCSAGTRSAYTDLVGVMPHNFAAASDGLLRVQAGNPQNSLIVRKILGQLDSPNFGDAAYGRRMPFHNPANDRKRKKLSKPEVQLISDWILQGAPAAGFVATTAKGACQ
jgi:hypothetical protein